MFEGFLLLMLENGGIVVDAQGIQQRYFKGGCKTFD
jgi:hypothetical protein